VRSLDNEIIMDWKIELLEALQAFIDNALQVEACAMGTLEANIPHATTIKKFQSCVQVVSQRCEECGDETHHGVEYRVLGSSTNLTVVSLLLAFLFEGGKRGKNVILVEGRMKNRA
jgi:hypothetical protein